MSFIPFKPSGFTAFGKKKEEEVTPASVPFAASRGDNLLVAGLKSAGNVPKSTYNLGKGIVSAVANPVDTLTGIGNSFLGGVNKGVEKLTGTPLRSDEQGQIANSTFNALSGALKDRYGSLDNLQKTATEDPMGFGADVLSIIEGGAGLFGKTAALESAISRTGQLVTNPLTKATGAVGDGLSKATKFGVSQATGLEPQTIQSIVNNPQQFSRTARASIDRPTLANEVKSALDTRIEALRDTGAVYDEIRQSGSKVNIPQGTTESVLSKYGVKMAIDENGMAKVITTKDSRPLSRVDRTAIEDFYNEYGRYSDLDSNSFLNTREALSNLSKYEQGKTSVPTAIAKELRAAYDDLGKSQIDGLRKLDATYSPERSLLDQAKKDFFNPDGSLKDAAISKIANASGLGKDKLLARLEELKPGITKKIKVLKAVEDIERASGLKVGSYARAIGVGGQAAMGNIPGAVITAILTAPEVAVPLIRGYGLTKPQIVKVLNTLRSGASDMNNFALPAGIKNSKGELKLGLSLDDVSGKTLSPFERKVLGVTDAVKETKVPSFGFDSKSGLPLKSEGQIDAILSEKIKSPYFDSLTKAAADRGNLLAKNRPDVFSEKIKRQYIEETNTRRINRVDDTGKALEADRADMSYKTANFERAKGLSPQDAAIEEKAYQKIVDKGDDMIVRNMADNGVVVNADDFKRQFKDVGYKGTNAAAVQEPSSYLAKKAFTKALKLNDGEFATFTAGGSGVGKSSALKNLPRYQELYKDSAVVLDSNLSNYDSAIKKIKEAQQFKKTPVSFYVYRDPIESLVDGVVKRMRNNPEEMGRIVPTKVIAGNHIGSLETAVKLRDNAGIEVVAVDNTFGFGKAKTVSLDDIVKKANYPSVQELTNKLNDEIRRLNKAGKVSDAELQGYIQ